MTKWFDAKVDKVQLRSELHSICQLADIAGKAIHELLYRVDEANQAGYFIGDCRQLATDLHQQLDVNELARMLSMPSEDIAPESVEDWMGVLSAFRFILHDEKGLDGYS